MTQENVVLIKILCIFVLWAGLRYAILKKPIGIMRWIFCIIFGSYAGFGIMVYVLLSKDSSVLFRIEWGPLDIIQLIVSLISVPFVLYAGIMLMARICTLCLEWLHEYRQRHR